MVFTMKIAIGAGPICPECNADGFDDWWHDPSTRAGVGIVSIQAELSCDCGEKFAVTKYTDGETHSMIATEGDNG